MRKIALVMSLLVIANLAYSQKEITKKKGESVTLTSVGGSGKSFQWYSGSCGGTLVDKGNKVIVTPQKTTTYYGRWEDGNEVSKCIWVTVIILEEPTAPIVQDKDTVYITKDTVIYKTDTVVKEKETVKEVITTVTTPSKPTPKANEKNYSFGKYKGELKDGIPDGEGTMYYTKHVQIAKHARETYYAEQGDVFVGTWGNGDIVNGKLFDKNNNLKASLLPGKRFNPYDISKD
jgi:hypothetical protein